MVYQKALYHSEKVNTLASGQLVDHKKISVMLVTGIAYRKQFTNADKVLCRLVLCSITFVKSS